MSRAPRKETRSGKAKSLEEGPEGHVTESGLWRYSVGIKGVNRVQVYERKTGATIYVEYRDETGRHQTTLTAKTGFPVTSHSNAIKIANRLAEELKAKNNRRALESVFGPSPGDHTLEELLDQLHADKASEWSPLHLKDQKRFQRFWLENLGRRTKLVNLTAAQVERVVRDEGDLQDWASRTRQAYLRYIVDAVYYAQKKLKWITEQNNLSAVTIPAARSESRSYSPEEIPLLLNALHQVDLRAAFVGEVAWQSGRRLNAIRNLTTDALLVRDDGVAVLQFPGTHDKARRTGEVVLMDRALDAAQTLLKEPAVAASGLFCVAGDLEDPTPRKQLTSEKALIQWLHLAEEAAGIESIPGRAYHGIKRRFATAAISHDETAAEKQSGTNKKTLQRQYVQDDIEPKIELARQLSAKRK